MAIGRYFKKAMEEQTTTEDVTIVIDPVEQETVAAGVDTVEEVADVQGRIAEIESGEEATEEGLGEIEVVEEQVENAEASVAEGGMDQTAAAAMDIAVEAFARKMTIKRQKPTGMAVEAFGGTSTRLRATKLAIEEAKGMAGKAWEAIIAFIEKAKKFVLETWGRIFDAKDKVVARAKAIAEKAKAFKGQQGEVTKAGLAAKVCIDGKVDAGTAIANLGSIPELQEAIMTENGKALQGLTKIDFSKPNEDTVKLINEIASNFEKYKTKDLSANDYDAPEGAKVYQVGKTQPGDLVSTVTFKQDATAPVLKFGFVKAAGVKAPEGDKLPSLTTAEIATLCANVEKMSAELKKSDAAMKAMKSTGDTLVNKIKNVRSGDENAATARRNVTQIYQLMGAPSVKISGVMIKSFNAMLDWANLSLGASKEETKAE